MSQKEILNKRTKGDSVIFGVIGHCNGEMWQSFSHTGGNKGVHE
jgi:hypothetical protein